MDTESAFKSSFYEEVACLSEKHGVSIVKRKDTGRLFIKRVLKDYSKEVFDILRAGDFDGTEKIFDCFEDEESHTLTVISEYVSGEPLSAVLDREGPLSLKRAVDIMVRLCDILAPLHRLDPPLIHRDIKPSNIMIMDDGSIVLIDFDASKVYDSGKTRDTELIGTEGYAAPEQYGFLQSDPRTDIYALGILGKAMLSPEDLSGKIGTVIAKCTNLDPDSRYKNVSKLKKDLEKVLHPGKKIEEIAYTLPGFRTGKLWKKVLAVFGYASILLFAVLPNYRYASAADNIKERVQFVITMFALILFTFNYLGIHQKLPLMNSKYVVVKVIGWYIYDFLIVTLVRILWPPDLIGALALF